MIKVPIRSIADVTAGQGAPKPDEFSDSGIPFVRAGSLEDLLAGKSESDLELVPAATAKKRKLKLYPSGSILFAKSGMSATKDRIYVLRNPAHVVSHLAILTSKDNVHRDYLRLALKQFPPSSLIKDPAYPAIGLGEIQGYEIPVPDEIDDQKRIAHLLGKVEVLIAQRKQHMQQLDDLLKSVFLEMFGDPVRNEKGWEPVTLGQIFKVASGNGLVAKDMDSDGPYNVYGGNGVNGTHSEYMFEEPTLVIGRVGYYCGSVHITEPKSWVTDNALYVKEYFRDVNTIYLKNLLEIIGLNKYAGRAAQPLVSGSRIYPIKTIDTPIDLQNQFATIVKKVEALKSRYLQSLTDLESLYGALSQKAFKGELDLSRVVLTTEDTESTEASNHERHEKHEIIESNAGVAV